LDLRLVVSNYPNKKPRNPRGEAPYLALARAAFAASIAEKPAGMFMVRQRRRVVKRHAGDW
jgi:hypothetical protein